MADHRARLRVKGNTGTLFGGPAAILARTRGILFPYSPNITVQSQVEYSQYDTQHTNYQQNAYSRTRTPNIQITADFVNQTTQEGLYTIGVLHFLRTATKMHFGRNDGKKGTPPPVLSFSAYGNFNFQNVPVLIGSFTQSYPNDVDYIQAGPSSVPAIMTIAIDLIPQYSARKQLEFSLDGFASGDLYNRGFI